MMDHTSILVVLNNSLGEVHFILPYLVKAKEELSVKVYYYFINSKIHDKAADDHFYYQQLSASGVIIKPNELFPFLYKNRRAINLILKDTTRLGDGNLVSKIALLCPNAQLALFPHAYALLGCNQKKELPPVRNDDSEMIDYVLYSNKYDAPVLGQRYSKDKLLNVGALGYSSWWKSIVKSYVQENSLLYEKLEKKDKSVVLLTLRDIHDIYLTENNFEYLLHSTFDFLFHDTDFFVIIKPHPRQSIQKINGILEVYDSSRYIIQNQNTFVLSCFADLNLSFWSSSVTDCLAMGIPTMEFHRFHKNFSQTILNDSGEIESFYSCLKLTYKVTSKEELKEAFTTDRQGLLKQQKQRMQEVFVNTSNDNFKLLFEGKKKRYSLGRMVRSYIYIFLKFLYRKLRPA
ncbi:hypothetical protein LVD17_25530 [Fulvivirga ulvae]|uniref:hypothetical protein n=1 Tax=Fulvivirga ulvae TaxID=2904245 RepID=UPI001F2C90B3|nr:hypothetical protein [Fulvivirga ulvae]UII31657.1 hypothetical protein LVD17_25530 [Fulvivirga ulvae]